MSAYVYHDKENKHVLNGKWLFTTSSTIAFWLGQLEYSVKILVILKSYRPLSPIAEYDSQLLLEVPCVEISPF